MADSTQQNEWIKSSLSNIGSACFELAETGGVLRVRDSTETGRGERGVRTSTSTVYALGTALAPFGHSMGFEAVGPSALGL